MFRRTARWITAFIIAAATLSIGCLRHDAPKPVTPRVPIVADDSLVHAFDTQMELRLIDRLELDNFLRERVAELIRAVPGVIEVDNHLDVRPPA